MDSHAAIQDATPGTRAARRLLGSPKMWAALVFLFALVLRLAWALSVDIDPEDPWRFDMSLYHFEASQLAAGNGYVHYSGEPTAHWPPGYPMTIAPLYYVFGDNEIAAQMLNVVLSSATVVLLYVLGTRLFGRPAGLTSALLLAAFPNQVFFTSLVLTEVLFTFLFVLVLVLTVYLMLGQRAPRLWQVALVGLPAGYAALVRGEALLLIAFIAPALLLRWRSLRRVLGYSAILLAATAAIVAPWTVRNIARMDSPILISTSGTEAFWIGHHDGANGRIAEFDVGMRYGDLPTNEREVKNNRVALEEALSFIRHHPIDDLKLIPSKLFALYKDDGSSMHWFQMEEHTLPEGIAAFFGGLASVYYWTLLPIAAVAVREWFSLRDPGKALLVGAVIYWTVMFGVVFFGDNRFHFPLMPVLSLWAAASIVTVCGRLHRRTRSEARVYSAEGELQSAGEEAAEAPYLDGEEATQPLPLPRTGE